MTQTYVTKVEVVNRTQVKKITIGTPIRKVTGAAAQGLNDLTDVNFGDLLADKVILVYDVNTGKFEPAGVVEGVIVYAGAQEPGDDF